MPLLIVLILSLLIMGLPVLIYNRVLRGKGGSINPGRQMGERQWRDANTPPEEETYR